MNFLSGGGGNRKSKGTVYRAGHQLPVLPVKKLLNAKRYQDLLDQLKGLANLPAEYFEPVYERLVCDFAEFVQLIPTTSTNYLGSLLNTHLSLAYATVWQAHRDSASGQLGKRKLPALWTFATFSAALLRGIGKTFTNQLVILTQPNGTCAHHWLPFQGSMLAQEGARYKLYFRETAYPGAHYPITTFLARQLLAPESFDWLASDEKVFTEWLQALRGDDQLEGRIISDLNAAKEFLETPGAEGFLLPFAEVEQQNTPETQDAEAFLQWLKNGIQSGQIKVNTSEAMVHTVAEGVLLESPKIFEQFVNTYGKNISAKVVVTQFGNLMGIAKKGGNDFDFSQYFSDNPDIRGMAAFRQFGKSTTTRTGIVLNETSLLFRVGEVPAISQYLQLMPSMTDAHQRLPNFSGVSSPGTPRNEKS